MSDLESRLALLREEVVWPPTPDLATPVAARIAAEPARRRAPRVLPALRPATIAVAAPPPPGLVAAFAIAVTLAAAPGVRARIEHWLGIGAVRVERVQRLPAVAPGPDLGL